MIIKIDLDRLETYQAYMKRERISKQNLNNRIVSGKVRIFAFHSINLKMIIK